MADKNSQVLLGTKLVTEGIDIRNLRMVIMMDCRPSIIEFIQAAGRLRSSGMFYLLSGTGARGESAEGKSDHPAVPLLEEGCVDEQMASFYGLGAQVAPGRHAEVLLAESQKLVASHRTAMEMLEREQETNVRKRAAEVPESLALERKKIKRDFHLLQYTDILLYIGLPEDMTAALFLHGIEIQFCPSDTFTRKEGCRNCLKDYDLCVCAGGKCKSCVQIACEALALQRMLMDDKEYSGYLEDITPYREDPVGYLEKALRDKDMLQRQVMKKYQWFRAFVCERKKIVASESRRGVEGSPQFSQPAKVIRDIYSDAWRPLRDDKLDVLEYFWSWEKKRCENVWKDEYTHCGPSFVEMMQEHGTFERIYHHTSARLQGDLYVTAQYWNVHKWHRDEYSRLRIRFENECGNKLGIPSWDIYLAMVIGMFYNLELRTRIAQLIEQISDVWLIPHWLRLQTCPW
ncbi:hypothetical protein HG537_0B07030 [Torulaspora globosa]|uniref:Helicase C-terminal domain-containing protein n=1 Tax=Torulaspora globosa TaxID=48254 RepID=A0A7H9HSJ9_9SACH|nr:hypothetical protein HG537_0B07030 [Torulaspora sp. CBS 2947]